MAQKVKALFEFCTDTQRHSTAAVAAAAAEQTAAEGNDAHSAVNAHTLPSSLR